MTDRQTQTQKRLREEKRVEEVSRARKRGGMAATKESRQGENNKYIYCSNKKKKG